MTNCLAARFFKKLRLYALWGILSFLPNAQAQTNFTITNGAGPTVNISGSQSSNLFRIDQSKNSATGQMLSSNYGNFAIAQGSNINIINFFGPTSPTVTKEAFEALERRLNETTNTVELTRKEVQLLASALKDLDERTSDIQKLPDGRTRLGAVVTGVPYVVERLCLAGQKSLDSNDYTNAFRFFTNAYDTAMRGQEAAQGATLTGSLTPELIAKILYAAGVAAQGMYSNDIADDYAARSIAISPSILNRALRITTLGNVGRKYLEDGDLVAAYDKLTNAVQLLQDLRKETNSLSDLINSHNQGRIFLFAAESAQQLLLHEVANELANTAVEIDPNLINRELLITTLLNVGRREDALKKVDALSELSPMERAGLKEYILEHKPQH